MSAGCWQNTVFRKFYPNVWQNLEFFTNFTQWSSWMRRKTMVEKDGWWKKFHDYVLNKHFFDDPYENLKRDPRFVTLSPQYVCGLQFGQRRPSTPRVFNSSGQRRLRRQRTACVVRAPHSRALNSLNSSAILPRRATSRGRNVIDWRGN